MNHTAKHFADLGHRRNFAGIQLVQLSDMPENRIQVTLHPRLFLGSQFQICQLGYAPHIVDRYSAHRVVPLSLHYKVYPGYRHTGDTGHLRLKSGPHALQLLQPGGAADLNPHNPICVAHHSSVLGQRAAADNQPGGGKSVFLP
jgi:hypothetical protein